MDSESKIANKKARKIAKHYPILINGKKVKIINYRFKKYKDPYESGQLVELISKIKFPPLPKLVKIEIKREGRLIQIQGRWKFGFHGPGNHIARHKCAAINQSRKGM